MSLFNFFNKNKNTEEQNSLYSLLSKYNEYIVYFILLQQKGDYAPAFETTSGEIEGLIYMNDEKGLYELSAEQVIQKMKEDFSKQLKRDKIASYIIFYHGYHNGNSYAVASNNDELKAIVINYHFSTGQQGEIALTYQFDNDEITYQHIKEFTPEENSIVFNTQLAEGKNYFQNRKAIEQPVYETRAGLKVTKSNTQSLENMWCGIFGFHYFRESEGYAILQEYFEQIVNSDPVIQNGDIAVSQLGFPDVVFRTIRVEYDSKTIFPVIKTDYIIDVENKAIDEWENVDDVEAIISASGRNTFGISYYATDYAINREKYHYTKQLTVNISAIAFVLDISQHDPSGKLSEDFTGYFPSNDLPNYACFDFIGKVEDYRETTLLNNGLRAYIIKTKLINHDTIDDFFTIDIYATLENMRFTNLEKGMKITGMIQLQGHIA